MRILSEYKVPIAIAVIFGGSALLGFDWMQVFGLLALGFSLFIVAVMVIGALDGLARFWSWLREGSRGRDRIVRIESRTGTYERDPAIGRFRRVSDEGNPFRSEESQSMDDA